MTGHSGFIVPGRTVEAGQPEESARVAGSVRLSSCLEVRISPTYGRLLSHSRARRWIEGDEWASECA